MFARYALAVGRGAHRHALLARSQSIGLTKTAETSDLLLVAPEDTPLLTDGRSILVGQLFSGGNERVEILPPEIASAGSSALGHALEGYWGNYALFFACRDQAGAYREPSGSVSVHRCGPGDQTYFVSDAELAMQLGILAAPRADLHFAVHWLQFPFLRTRRTGLEDISELLPGMLGARDGSGPWVETSIWHPGAFVGRDLAITDAAAAETRIRELALSVVPAQAGSHGIALRLSGGLDSSIIAACLSNAGRDFSAINFVTRSPDGDERLYAREVATQCGAPLQEIAEPEGGTLELPARHSFRPTINPLLAPFERAARGAATGVHASLLLDGAGGDNLFCSISTASPVLDALRAGGFRQAAGTITDIAERANCTLWDVVLAATRRSVRRRPRWKEDRSFLATDCTVRRELHPWLERLDAPPGKREHVEAIVHIQHFLDRGVSPVSLLHPLLAQPLLELCLRIPSWMWLSGGRDRAVARDAFAGIVPASVLRRRAKGSLQSMFHRSFSRLREEMLDLLLSGELRAAGIIDPASIEAALGGDGWMADEVQLRISEMVALELWLQSWRSPSTCSSVP
ncbi:MAG: asparagine synthase C-terminal domain-containing protein [Pseudomonadota bacterium]|nr:asparagine synthase C-terminal domain-containing protein [Pseudomonadota bacterium]